MDIQQNVKGKIANLQIVKEDGTVKKSFSFKNDFLKSFFDREITEVVNDPGYFSYLFSFDKNLFFGTGTEANSPNFLGLTSPDPTGTEILPFEEYETNVDGLPKYDPITNTSRASYVYKYRTTNPGTFAGTWTEVGLGDRDGNMMTRALITDDLGNPTSITILSDEYVLLDYQIDVEITFPVKTGTLTLASGTYNYKVYGQVMGLRLYNKVSSYNEAIGIPIVRTLGRRLNGITYQELETEFTNGTSNYLDLGTGSRDVPPFDNLNTEISKVGQTGVNIKITVPPSGVDIPSFTELVASGSRRTRYGNLYSSYARHSPITIFFDKPVILAPDEQMVFDFTMEMIPWADT